MPVLLAALGPLLLQGLRWFFLAKLASFVTRLFVTFGIAFTSYKFLIEPLVDQVKAAWQGVPSDLAVWVSAFGVDKCVSIVLSGYLIYGVKRLFLTSRS